MKILAVDDDETILELLEAALVALGYENAEFVSSGPEALDILAAADNQFDCILTDIQMPDMDGITLCREIQALPAYKHVPIIMVTAMSDRIYIDRAFAAGATDYVTKPFDILELNTRLGLAGNLASERRLAADRETTVEALKEELEGQHSYQLAEPVEFPALEKALSNQAFENYLAQLGRFSLFQSSVFAVKIANIETMHSDLSSLNYYDVLRAVAVSIANNLKFSCSFLAYRGNGIFLCIDHKDGIHLGRATEYDRPDQLLDLHLALPDGSQLELDIFIGDLVSLGVFAKSNALHYLRSAVENVEAKYGRQISEHTSSAGPKIDPEEQQQPYKSLLLDSLNDGLYQDDNVEEKARHKHLLRG